MTLKDDPIVLLGWSCPYCGNPTKLVDSSEIYGRSIGGKCWYCKPCHAWVGCHKDSDRALGRVANKQLRELKHQAHEAFDRIWKDGHLPRSAAYELLSIAFDLPPEQTHIGMFDEELCEKVIALSKAIYKYTNQYEWDREINPQSDLDLHGSVEDPVLAESPRQVFKAGWHDNWQPPSISPDVIHWGAKTTQRGQMSVNVKA